MFLYLSISSDFYYCWKCLSSTSSEFCYYSCHIILREGKCSVTEQGRLLAENSCCIKTHLPCLLFLIMRSCLSLSLLLDGNYRSYPAAVLVLLITNAGRFCHIADVLIPL